VAVFVGVRLGVALGKAVAVTVGGRVAVGAGVGVATAGDNWQAQSTAGTRSPVKRASLEWNTSTPLL